MKLYVFERLDRVSHAYHSEGGLAIVATHKGKAKRMIEEYNENTLAELKYLSGPAIEITDDEWEEVIIYDLAGDYEPCIYVFPDAGCC